ncbi:hypothetical protein H0H93_009592 [Arthromyces matolae]|nr:hypothetical protein H0H93_009592 [Arthromyces matolae]
MNIIHSQILLSAISLALLVVSATPIPSFEVMSREDSKALMEDFTTESTKCEPFGWPEFEFRFLFKSLLVSKLRSPTVTKLFTRSNNTRLTPTLDSLLNLSQKIFRAWWNIMPENAVHGASHRQGDPVNAKDIKNLERFISELTDADVNHPQFDWTTSAIPEVKLLVLDWPSDKRSDAIKDIEACEAAKRLPRSGAFYRRPEQMKDVLDEFEKELDAIDLRFRWTRVNKLAKLVTIIAFLTIEEQGTIQKELEDAYKTVKAKIDKWEAAYDKDTDKEWAEWYLKKWEGLNSLIAATGFQGLHNSKESK